MDKYLIVGLGNPGDEYAETRHNTGWMVLDAFAKASNIVFEDKRYGFVAETSLRYWLNKENIDQSRLLVVSDDVAIPVGQFRLKGNGSNGGHNGLGHIQQLIGQQYARLRMGIGNDYPVGSQIDHVLGRFLAEEREKLEPAITLAVDIIKSFVLAGIDITMNQYNKLGKGPKLPKEPKVSKEPQQ